MPNQFVMEGGYTYIHAQHVTVRSIKHALSVVIVSADFIVDGLLLQVVLSIIVIIIMNIL